MNLWLTEVVAAAHVDELLRQAGQPVRPAATGGFTPLRAERPAFAPFPHRSGATSRMRPRIGGLLIRAGTRLGGAAPAGPRVATGAGC